MAKKVLGVRIEEDMFKKLDEIVADIQEKHNKSMAEFGLKPQEIGRAEIIGMLIEKYHETLYVYTGEENLK